MINLVKTQVQTAQTSDNVLPIFSTFQGVFVYNKLTNPSSATIQNINFTEYYFGQGCLGISFTGTNEVKFNSGGSQLEQTIRRTGNYILQMQVKTSTITDNVRFVVEMLVNGVAYPNSTFEVVCNSANQFEVDKWNCYFNNIALEDGDLIDFNFYTQSDTTGIQLYIDGFKLELDDRNLVFPSFYTEPIAEIVYEETILTIPSIASNSTYVAVINLQGLNIGEAFIIWADNQLTDEGLVIGYPTFKTTNEINVLLHNHSGSGSTILTDVTFYAKKI